MLRLSSSVVCNVCIVAKRCVLEQKLLLTAYKEVIEKSIGTKMNEFDLCLEVAPLNISETVRDRAFVPKGHQ